jgi:hypothetical protein
VGHPSILFYEVDRLPVPASAFLRGLTILCTHSCDCLGDMPACALTQSPCDNLGDRWCTRPCDVIRELTGALVLVTLGDSSAGINPPQGLTRARESYNYSKTVVDLDKCMNGIDSGRAVLVVYWSGFRFSDVFDAGLIPVLVFFTFLPTSSLLIHHNDKSH